MGKLYIVGTPIGNLDDMPIKNLNYLKNAKNILAENPQIFTKLCQELKIDKSDAKVLYAHTWPDYIGESPELILQCMTILKEEDLYVVCDGGMPGISDPGGWLVIECIKAGIEVIATPGPSVISTAAIKGGLVSGFAFLGFLPKEKDDREFLLKNMCHNPLPNLFLLINRKEYFEEAFNDLVKIWGDRDGALLYNLTTNKETIVYGTLSGLKREWFDRYAEENEVCLVVDGVAQHITMPIKRFET